MVVQIPVEGMVVTLATLLTTLRAELNIFINSTLQFFFQLDQSVFTVCPSKPDMLPGMVLVFELFILRGPVTPTDKVVGWGCFPICDSEFNVIEGK